MKIEFTTKRIQYEDDLVIVYNRRASGENQMLYKGLVDYNPYKDMLWRWEEALGRYVCGSWLMYCLDV